MVKVSLHADDLGASASHSRAIVHCFDLGVLDGASLLVNHGEALPETLALLADRPQLRLRLHLNLSEGRPLCSPQQIPLLCQGDWLCHSLGSLGWLWLRSGIGRRQQLEQQLHREVLAQVEAFREILRQLGRPAKLEVDGHEHLHLLPFVRRQLETSWARADCSYLYFSDLPSRALWANRFRGLASQLATPWRRQRKPMLWTGTIHPQWLPGRIRQLGEGADVEVLFHPRGPLTRDEFAFLPTRRHRDAYSDPARLREYQLLCDFAPALQKLRQTFNPDERFLSGP